MPRVISFRDPTPASLEECVDELAAWGFDPVEETSLSHAANWLRRLGNNPDFLGDVLVDMLAGRTGAGMGGLATQGAGLNRIPLTRPDRGNFFITADIWPSSGDHALRANTPEVLGYGIVHDHNCDVLNLGYFGPGCDVDEYEYDPQEVSGWRGEPVMLKPLGRARIQPGRLVHYRARRDVLCLHPPETLSVTLTLSHAHGAQEWFDHYTFERRKGRTGAFHIARVHGHGPSETFLQVAVALGGEDARDLAHHFGKDHPSDRMRLTAWRALANAAPDEAAREAVWREAEGSGSRAVAEVAKRQRS